MRAKKIFSNKNRAPETIFRNFSETMLRQNRQNLIFAGTIICLVFAAFFLRFLEINFRPFHSDEAVQAWKVGEMLSGKNLLYDPENFHGLTLYYFAFWICKIFGISNFENLSETFLRAVPAAIGAIFSVAVPAAFFGKNLPKIFIAGALFLASATAIFFAGYFIQETLFVSFFWAGIGVAFFRKKNLKNAILAGTLLGLGAASKESFVLFFPAIFFTAFAIFFTKIPAKNSLKNGAKFFGISAGTALILAAIFYTSFGKNFRGIPDFFSSLFFYFDKAAGTPNSASEALQNDVFYYVKLLFEADFSAAILAIFVPAFSAILIFWKRKFPQKIHGNAGIFAGVSGTTIFILYSIFNYKNPWLILSALPGIFICAAEFFYASGTLLSEKFGSKIFKKIAVFAVLPFFAISLRNTLSAKLDENSPLRFVHTSSAVPEISNAVKKARERFENSTKNLRKNENANAPEAASNLVPETFFVAFALKEYWPLPWFLRGEKFGVWGENSLENLAKIGVPVIISEVENWENFDSAAPEISKKFRTIFCSELRKGILIEAREFLVPEPISAEN